MALLAKGVVHVTVVEPADFGVLDLLDTVEKILQVASNKVFYWDAGAIVCDVDFVKLWLLLQQ